MRKQRKSLFGVSRLPLVSAVLATLALTSAATVPLHAQTPPTPAAKFVDSARAEIDAAVLADDAARLGGAIVLLDRALSAFPKDPYLLHYRGYARYRQIVSAFRAGKVDGLGPLISNGIADLQQSSDKLPWPETYSLWSALLGFRIAGDPSLGPELGAEIGTLSAEATKLGPNNPRVLLLLAYGAQNTPPEYGGGVDRARTYAERAVAAFETDKPAALSPTWGKLEAQALLKALAGTPR